MAEQEYVSKKEFNITRDNIEKRLSGQESRVAVLESRYSTLDELQHSMQTLSTNMALMDKSLQDLGKQFERYHDERERDKREQLEADRKQNRRISEIDDKSKVDIVSWLKSKWFEIITAVVLVITLFKEYIVN